MGDHPVQSGGFPLVGTTGTLVSLDHIVGRVVAVWWPLGAVGGLGRADPLGAPVTVSSAQEATA